MITFKKQSLNGHTFLVSVQVPIKEANLLISKNSDKGGWYTFKVQNNKVIVGNNLWNDLNLNKYL